MTNELMIEAENLVKQYGETRALAGVSLAVPTGSILGVLGPNGAGKTTAVRILTTLSQPTSGSARVAGFDVVHQAAAVRERIGVTAQDATVDELLTGRQNLRVVAELSGMRAGPARQRTVELLERFDLTDAADRVVKGYSGGMRRRLDLAASLVSRPPMLFLDEPTTGLDPTSRNRMWDVIRELVADGTTILLTTQYLEEADKLADRIVVIDHGLVIAEGSAPELKAAIGGARLEITLSTAHDGAVGALASFVSGPVQVTDEGRRLAAPVRSSSGLANTVVRALDAAGVLVDDIEVRQPSLDDVFFALTGNPATDSQPSDESPLPELEGARP